MEGRRHAMLDCPTVVPLVLYKRYDTKGDLQVFEVSILPLLLAYHRMLMVIIHSNFQDTKI